jgi:hypothetical protein
LFTVEKVTLPGEAKVKPEASTEDPEATKSYAVAPAGLVWNRTPKQYTVDGLRAKETGLEMKPVALTDIVLDEASNVPVLLYKRYFTFIALPSRFQ